MFKSTVHFCAGQQKYIFTVRGDNGEFSTGMRDTLAAAEAAARAAVRSYRKARR